MYTLSTNQNTIIRDTDGSSIPFADGNIDYEEYLEWLAAGNTPTPFPSPSLAEVKATQTKLIMDGFNIDSVDPVLVGTVTYNGGFDSAMKMDAAQRLMESAGATTVDFYDVDNVAHTLSFVDATKVVQGVAGAYQISFAKKQTKLVAIAQASTVADVQMITW